MKNKFIQISLLLFCYILTSCSSSINDGDWPPMKWETKTVMDKKKNIIVPDSGGIYTFTCKNYNEIWISSMYEYIPNVDTTFYYNTKPHNLEGKWSSIKIDNNIVTVAIKESNSKDKRHSQITLTAGDIIDVFFFLQKENNERE